MTPRIKNCEINNKHKYILGIKNETSESDYFINFVVYFYK